MIILMYHRLSDDSKKDNQKRKSPYILGLSNFKYQVEYMYLHKYIIHSLSDFLTNLIEIDRSKSLVITFDDGHISSYSVAFPILCNYKFKATFFIITERIGEKEYLSWRQIREKLLEI